MNIENMIKGIDAVIADEQLWSAGKRILKRIRNGLQDYISIWSTKEYKCTKCGLEIIVAKLKSHKLPKAECQDCGTMTMKPKN